jgi:NADH-quinone oxidoreductase subunit L
VITAPLLLLAFPSVVIGFLTIEPMLFGDLLKDAIAVDNDKHPAIANLAHEFHGAAEMALHGLMSAPFWLALAGVASAWFLYMYKPHLPAAIKSKLQPLYTLLDNKYYMDWFNEHVLARAARGTGRGLWRGGDVGFIDNILIDGSARTIGGISALTRQIQSGYLYWYALVMIVGVIGLMTWQLWPFLGALLMRP